MTLPSESLAAPEPSAESIHAALRTSVSWWSATARAEAVPADRLWVCFSCRACGAVFDRVFRAENSPWAGVGTPLYRAEDEIGGLVDSLFAGRPAVLDAASWKEARRCACRAPAHLSQVVGAGLFHTVAGSGAGIVVARSAGEDRTSWWRLTDGSAALEPLDAEHVGRVFGRPFTLFGPWQELARNTVERGSVAGVQAEPGVLLFAAAHGDELTAALHAKLGRTQRIVVRLEAKTVDEGWPAALQPLRDRLDAGTAYALVVEQDALVAQARAWARTRLGADVLETNEGLRLSQPGGAWPLTPAAIALSMVRYGRTLAEACALGLHAANIEIADRIATLEALTGLVPGASFEIEGMTATARRADGRTGQTLELSQIPSGAASLGPENLVREAAFLFDTAPPWADRTQVCPCGAAASMERRLVAWPWRGEPDATPWVVRSWGDANAPGAAEVVALCCDRHVRILARRELVRLGVDERRLSRELDATLHRTRPRIRASVWTRDGQKVVVAQGPFISGAVLTAGRMVALDEALGGVIGSRAAIGWAVGTDTLALTARTPEADGLVKEALAECGIGPGEPFSVRCEVDLSGPSIGRFDLKGPRA